MSICSLQTPLSRSFVIILFLKNMLDSYKLQWQIVYLGLWVLGMKNLQLSPICFFIIIECNVDALYA